MRHGKVKASKSRDTTSGSAPARILIVGGGCVGMYTALRLRAKSRPRETEIVLVAPEPYMTYQPFLPEAAAGSISPRHVVVPLRRVLRGCRLLVGEAVTVDHAARTAHVRTKATDDEGTGPLEVGYDELVMAPGSVSRTLPVPGLAHHGIGFKTVEEAIGLRNHVLEQMDIASSTRDPALRDAALTFVFVGGGYAGVEALGELEDMARYATRHYHNIQPEDLKWLLIEAADRVLPEVGPDMGRYALRELRRRKIDVRLTTRLESCERRVAVLSDGSRHPTRTLVWTAGVKPHPLLAATDLPLDGRGRLRCTPELAVVGTPHAWAAGDAAAVPDLTVGPVVQEPAAGAGAPAERTATPPPNLPRAPPHPPVRANAPPTPSTPSARPRCSPTTCWPRCAARPRSRTGTPTPDRSPRWGCTRASPTSTDAS